MINRYQTLSSRVHFGKRTIQVYRIPLSLFRHNITYKKASLLQIELQLSIRRVYFLFPKVILRALNKHNGCDKSWFKEITWGHRTSATGLMAKAKAELDKEDGGDKVRLGCILTNY